MFGAQKKIVLTSINTLTIFWWLYLCYGGGMEGEWARDRDWKFFSRKKNECSSFLLL